MQTYIITITEYGNMLKQKVQRWKGLERIIPSIYSPSKQMQRSENTECFQTHSEQKLIQIKDLSQVFRAVLGTCMWIKKIYTHIKI